MSTGRNLLDLHRVARVVLFAAIVCLFVGVSATSAYAAPGVANAKFSSNIAYELKSMLSTRFTCDVDSAGTWGRLDILSASGVVKTVYDGPMTAGTNWLPLWNGMNSKGQRMPSAAYDWRLTVTKSGESTVARGKITVSKIAFIIKGNLANLDSVYLDRYMIPGTANIYYQVSNNSYVDSLYMYLWAPSDDIVGTHMWGFDENDLLKGTLYLRNNPGNDTSCHERGLHTFDLSAANDVTFYMTVIQ